MTPRRIGVVTGARSDYGLLRPVMRAIGADPDLALVTFATGMHLSRELGYTVEEIEADGFAIDERVDMLAGGDAPADTARSMARGTAGFADVYERNRPDLLLFLGDRFEVHAAVVAAVPFRIPLAHIHGGEITLGAIDDTWRHSLSKMSHLHFAANELCAQRLRDLGEEPWRIHVSGAPGLDSVRQVPLMPRDALAAALDLDLTEPPLLCTFHPVTAGETDTELAALLEALDAHGGPIVMTYPNADAGGQRVIRDIEAFARTRPRVRLFVNLGTERYLSLMACAAAVVGNSSSGIIEAASFELPVVNVGSRQDGRMRGRNVLDAPGDAAAIAAALATATSPSFRASLAGLDNPYGDGRAAERITAVIRDTPLSERLLRKQLVTGAPR